MKYIFEVTVNPGYSVEDYAAAWLEASHIIQQASGARGTFLHRDLDNPDRALAIAHWHSRADRQASASRQDPRVREIIQAQSKHVRIRLIGEFDEPQWQVLPPAMEQASDTVHHKNQAPGC